MPQDPPPLPRAKSSIPPAIRNLPVSWPTVALTAVVLTAAVASIYLDERDLAIGLFGAVGGLLMRIRS